ncbi:CaiB/BaiF CoA transferase family protein [Micromonospora cremea]|uniref:Crotonobetainyl-CoA:carnitine CoA-transferase CaiB n=1 Tax=Micromonospora cremea TaxID=709881 RepID=A0A1N5TE78_9ACTN|nr:CaiB/BaiF CoA-transferase family protein [Micromonospora cremea]SIM46385.1 Crotonobetainyl-CoA:carnitine CoA-transferase CaiB [Micromonospora cremea]
MSVLDGVTVVALEQAVAAPFATRQLADLGARVIKIERPGRGDFARDYDQTVRGMSSHFVWLNRSKHSVELDLKTPAGRDAVLSLVETADVFVQNLAPGAAERLGLGPGALRERNPRLVYCSISGYGPSGPYADKKAYDLLVQCETGFVSLTGTPEAPAKAGVAVADIAAGMYAYSGILAALLRRANTGQGATLEVSMLEALGEWMGYPLYFSQYGGDPPPRSGTSHATIAPYGPVPCADGTVFIGVQNQREWSALCSALLLRRPGLVEEPRFATNSLRVRHRAELDDIIGSVTAELTTAQVTRLLDECGIANARLRTVDEFADHEQLRSRDRWREVGSPVGLLRTLLPPAVLDGEAPVLGPVPELGEHTAQVLSELPARPPGSADRMPGHGAEPDDQTRVGQR